MILKKLLLLLLLSMRKRQFYSGCKMDWMGFESTISALPDTFCQRIVMERQIDAVQTTWSTVFLAFPRLHLTVHGHGANNTASVHIKSFQSFD
jgi:hypothetical protein